MLDIKFVRENPDAVKENIKKKFQDAKLPLVDEVIEKDAKYRAALKEVEALKAARNKLSKANGPLFGQLKKCTDEAQKAELQAQIDANNAAVKADADKMAELEKEEEALSARIQEIMYSIPQMIDPSVPIGPDDTYNVEAQRFGEPVVPDFPIPYHTEIMESFDGIDMDAAGRVAGNGFYYLLGNIARLHEAVLAYARDFMINKGFTYVIPPFMMHGNVVQGVMSFPEMDAMMYKIEGEDLYLIGTSEHTMIGRFIDQTLDESKMPLTLTSYSPCFRKEKGAHGIEERGIYRIHQFEKQEMIVVCRPEESADWYEKLWQMSVELFRSMDIQRNMNNDEIEIVQGGANGVDSLAKQYAHEHNMSCMEFKADWKQFGKAAGPIRNNDMAKYSDMLIAFQPELPTKGTQNMINTAKKYRLTRFIVIKENSITKIKVEK